MSIILGNKFNLKSTDTTQFQKLHIYITLHRYMAGAFLKKIQGGPFNRIFISVFVCFLGGIQPLSLGMVIFFKGQDSKTFVLDRHSKPPGFFFGKACSPPPKEQTTRTSTPWKFNSSPLKISHPKRKVIFQPSFLRGALLNFRGVETPNLFLKNKQDGSRKTGNGG